MSGSPSTRAGPRPAASRTSSSPATTTTCRPSSPTRDGESRPEDLTLAARNALLNMIDHLQEHGGWSRQQAYAICSVAVDLKVSEGVDVPSFVVSAFLPLDIFQG